MNDNIKTLEEEKDKNTDDMLFETENLKLSYLHVTNAEDPFSNDGLFTQRHIRNSSMGIPTKSSSNMKHSSTMVLSNEKNKNSITKFQPMFSKFLSEKKKERSKNNKMIRLNTYGWQLNQAAQNANNDDS